MQAEFRQAFGYRITELGRGGAVRLGEREFLAPARRKLSEHQMSEYAVLDALAEGELVREERLRTATGASREVLRTLQQKKWIVREDLSGVRDARRLVKIAVLREAAGERADEAATGSAAGYGPTRPSGHGHRKRHKLNAAQQRIVDLLRRSAGAHADGGICARRDARRVR